MALASSELPCVTSADRIRLYYSPGACSMAVHIVLEELGLEYEIERVMISEGENLREPFLSVNPRGRLPVLAVGDEVLRETNALLLYLATRWPKRGLAPVPGTLEFSRCVEWLSWITGTHHVHLMNFWRPHRISSDDSKVKEISRNGREKFREGTFEIENAIAGDWFLGDAFSVVDAYLLFCYRQGNRIGLSMSAEFPRFTALAERSLNRASVKHVFEREHIDLEGQWPPYDPALVRTVQ